MGKKITQSSTPLVSVYIPNHNYGKYVEQAIESVLNQTFKDFEIIVIDDGSTDGSVSIIRRYSNHPKITTIFQNNKGLTTTNNIALHSARGLYIIRLDADDYFDIHALQILVDVFENNSKVGMVFPDYFVVDGAGSVINLVRRHDFDGVTLRDQPAHGAGTMIRRKFLVDIGGYNEELQCQDGYELWVRFIERYEVRNVNLPLFYYRQHPKSLSRKESLVLNNRAKILKEAALTRGAKLATVAVVPIRGNNLDLMSMPFRKLGGKALIDWTLDEVLKTRRIEIVVVTTPDEGVLKHVAEKYGDRVAIKNRDETLALPNRKLEATLNDAMEWLTDDKAAEVDAIMTLSIECPFRSAHNIDMAVDIMETFDTDTVIAVKPETDNFYIHDGHGLQPFHQSSELRLERNELYRDIGLLRLTRRSFLDEKTSWVGGRMGHVVVEEQNTLCVDSEHNWEIAGLIAEGRLSEKTTPNYL